MVKQVISLVGFCNYKVLGSNPKHISKKQVLTNKNKQTI